MRQSIPAAHAPNCTEPKGRRGVTLTEVLMSLMIMSIGVSAVAVLFPISMLRSLQATQLTNAAILKYKVDAFLDSNPDLIFDPDGDGDLLEHFQRPVNRNYVVDPFSFYTLAAEGSPFTTSFGNDGTIAAGSVTRFGGGLRTLQGVDVTAANATELQALSLYGKAFGNQGDGWTTILDAVPIAVTSQSIEFDSSVVSLADVPTSEQQITFSGSTPHIVDPENFQIVLFSNDGTFSQAFPLLSVNVGANTATWSEDLTQIGGANARDFNGNQILDRRPLPLEFYSNGTSSPPVVSRALIQHRRLNDFSWFLTVRRRGDGAVRNMDIVVRFSDGADPLQERLFEATFIRNSTLVGIRNASNGDIPNIRRGKFVFDAVNSQWYRVQDVISKPLFTTGSQYDASIDWATYDHLVVLESDVKANAGTDASDGALDGDGAGAFGLAMFPAGIVDVYPTGSRSLPLSSN